MSKKDKKKYYVDENVVRIVAAQVSIVALLSLLNHWTIPFGFLAIDFALRAFTYQPSPLVIIAKIISSVLKLKPKLIFSAPKKFAAGIGFVFSFTIIILLILHLYTIADIVGGILIICAILESVFKICLGCYFYSWIVAPLISRKNNQTK